MIENLIDYLTTGSCYDIPFPCPCPNFNRQRKASLHRHCSTDSEFIVPQVFVPIPTVVDEVCTFGSSMIVEIDSYVLVQRTSTGI